MKLLGSGFHPRAEAANFNDPALWTSFGHLPIYETSKAGQNITVHRALQVSPFYAGVRFISEVLGMVPISMYQRLDERSKQKMPGHPLHQTLHSQPNPWMTAKQWKQCMTANAILRGNGFSHIVWEGTMVRQLVPLSSDRMRVEFKDSGEPEYLYTSPKTNKPKRFKFDEIFHLPGFGDGIVGISVVELAKETLGLALALEQHAAYYFSRGADLGGTITFPNEYKKETFERLEKSFNERLKDHAWILVPEGGEPKPIGRTNVESQFLEARRFIIYELARYLGLPPHVLAELERAIKSNIEESARELVVFHLLPWFVKWEQVIRRDLILYPERYFAEFNVDMLLRGDTKARWEAYKIGLEHGVWNPDYVRAKENENPREDGLGGRYMMPLNFTTAGSLPEGGERAQQALQQPVVLVLSGGEKLQALQLPQSTAVQPQNGEKQSDATAEKARCIAEASAERLVRKEIAAMERWGPRHKDKDSAIWERWLSDWYAKHRSALVENMRIDEKAAEDYCNAGIKEILEEGYESVKSWIPRKKDELTAIALGERQ